MLTRRQAIKALCAAAVAVVAPIPALGAAIPAATGKILFRTAGKPVLDTDGPCPCCRCDLDDPVSFTVTLETLDRTYVLHPTGDGRWECREPDGVFSVMADGNGRVEISGCC